MKIHTKHKIQSMSIVIVWRKLGEYGVEWHKWQQYNGHMAVTLFEKGVHLFYRFI